MILALIAVGVVLAVHTGYQVLLQRLRPGDEVTIADLLRDRGLEVVAIKRARPWQFSFLDRIFLSNLARVYVAVGRGTEEDREVHVAFDPFWALFDGRRAVVIRERDLTIANDRKAKPANWAEL